jgi:hypothetical protein
MIISVVVPCYNEEASIFLFYEEMIKTLTSHMEVQEAVTPEFILVGILNTIAGSAIMFVLYNLAGFGYWASSLLNCGAASVLSFFLNKYFTFGVREWSFYFRWLSLFHILPLMVSQSPSYIGYCGILKNGCGITPQCSRAWSCLWQ